MYRSPSICHVPCEWDFIQASMAARFSGPTLSSKYPATTSLLPARAHLFYPQMRGPQATRGPGRRRAQKSIRMTARRGVGRPTSRSPAAGKVAHRADVSSSAMAAVVVIG